MRFFRRMKYVYTLALAATISCLITTDYASPAGDALVGVLACSIAVMMWGESRLADMSIRMRFYRMRYRELVRPAQEKDDLLTTAVKLHELALGSGPVPDPRALADTSLPEHDDSFAAHCEGYNLPSPAVSPIPHSTRMPWCSPDTCSNAAHYPSPAVSPMPLEDIERSQGA